MVVRSLWLLPYAKFVHWGTAPIASYGLICAKSTLSLSRILKLLQILCEAMRNYFKTCNTVSSSAISVSEKWLLTVYGRIELLQCDGTCLGPSLEKKFNGSLPIFVSPGPFGMSSTWISYFPLSVMNSPSPAKPWSSPRGRRNRV